MALPAFKLDVINTTLNYHLDPSKGGHTEYHTGVSEYYRRKWDVHEVRIEDARSIQDDFTLDVQGFQLASHISFEIDFDDDMRIKQVVYPETEHLVKAITGATKVHAFSHLTRKHSREDAERAVEEDPTLQDNMAPYPNAVPSRAVHVDFSNSGAQTILRDNFASDLVEKLMKTRWAIVSAWRPIKPISRDPLAVCDARTAREEDFVTITSYLPPKGSGQYADVTVSDSFELLYKRYDPGEKWYYFSDMNQYEVLMIKIFDTLNDGKTARRTPHSAFVDPATQHHSTRESIEIRCLVFFEDQPS